MFRTLALTLALLSSVALGCRSERVVQVELAVDGMVCESCVEAITYEVGRLEGVQKVEVDLDAGAAVVTYVEGTLEPETIEQTIEAIGYQAEPGAVTSVESP